jgi:hypothetical protein
VRGGDESLTFAEARDLFGAGQARNRPRAAIESTVPFSLYRYTIAVAWYALHGRHPKFLESTGERGIPLFAALCAG